MPWALFRDREHGAAQASTTAYAPSEVQSPSSREGADPVVAQHRVVRDAGSHWAAGDGTVAERCEHQTRVSVTRTPIDSKRSMP